MKIRVKITQDVIESTAINENFFKTAMRELFEDVCIITSGRSIWLTSSMNGLWSSRISKRVRYCLAQFRVDKDVDPFSFECDVPYEVIKKIGEDKAYKVLSESKTLELVSIQ